MPNPIRLTIKELPYQRNKGGWGKGHAPGHGFGHDQGVRSFLWVLKNGYIRVDTQFENGRTFDTDHFWSLTAFLDGNGQVVKYTIHSKEVRHKKHRRLRHDTYINPELAATIKKIFIRYGRFGDDNGMAGTPKFHKLARTKALEALDRLDSTVLPNAEFRE